MKLRVNTGNLLGLVLSNSFSLHWTSQVFYAIKDAVASARKANTGESAYFEMRMPATSERIRMYVADVLVAEAVTEMKKEETPATSFQPQGSY